MQKRIDNDWYDELLSLTNKISRRKEDAIKELSIIDLEIRLPQSHWL